MVEPEAKIRAAAEQAGVDLSPYTLVATAHSHAAAAIAVALARDGKVEALMKGALHTDELMREVVAEAGELRTARRINAGSSSIKFSLFPADARPSRRDLLCDGEMEGIDDRIHFFARDAAGRASSTGSRTRGATTRRRWRFCYRGWKGGFPAAKSPRSAIASRNCACGSVLCRLSS